MTYPFLSSGRQFLHKQWRALLCLAAHPRAVLWLMVCSLLEAIILPIPPEALLLPMCLARPKHSIRLAGYCTLSSVVGACATFAFGVWAWGLYGDWCLAHIAGLNPGTLGTAKAFFAVYGAYAVFMGGFTPLPFKLVALAAGILDVHFGAFLSGALLGRGLRYAVLAYLVGRFGAPMHAWLEKHFNLLAACLGVILVIVLWFCAA